VVPDNFELFCLGFILVEDCVATLNIPLHTGGKKGPLKKTRSVTTKTYKNSIKKRTVEKQKGLHRNQS
jgi:hypothetical protein